MTALTSRDDGWDTRARSPTVTYTYAAYVEKLPVSMHGLGRAQHVAYKCHCCSQQPTRLPAATHHWIEPTPRDAKNRGTLVPVQKRALLGRSTASDHIHRLWRRRYLVLIGGRLEWYADQVQAEAACADILDLVSDGRAPLGRHY